MGRDRKRMETGRVVNSLRQGQLFGPWGTGSILPCPDGSSVMIAGLDAFPEASMKAVSDRRLSRYIGVKRLLSPPLDDADNATVPSLRFPTWLYCPSCGAMYKCHGTEQVQKKCANPHCMSKIKPKLVPERFIVVCPEGHVDDFPIVEWVHGGPVEDPSRHQITRITRGGSASLNDIKYQCECGASRTLQSATSKGALESCGFTCRGSQPWLDKVVGDCSVPASELRVVQRGGTNVWYSDVVSSIYIPEGSDRDRNISRFVDEHFEELSKYSDNEDLLDVYIDGLVRDRSYSVGDVKEVFMRVNEDEKTAESENEYRAAEYEILRTLLPSRQQKGTFEGNRVDISEYDSVLINRLIKSISLITTLKETKALVGFTRLYPSGNDEKSFSDRRRSLSRSLLPWTLGLQMTGEGIFIEFNKEELQNWASSGSAKSRISIMQKNFNNYQRSRGESTQILNPWFLLIHTLSHILMLELSKTCGYSSASIKERVYCERYLESSNEDPSMCGLLIYTASDDSEGSLGGLVRAGRPGRFEEIFESALSSAVWCSSDPVCIESPGQGQGSCNLAACYSCALLPETSCECGNRLLDRALLVGALDDPSVGLVGEFLRDGKPFDFSKEKLVETSYDVSYESVPSGVEGESFEGICECILGLELSPEEERFLEDLIALSKTKALLKPLPYVEFSNERGSAEPAFVWPQKKIVLLLGDSVRDFEEVFGPGYECCAEWDFYTLDKVADVKSFSEEIKG